MTGIRVIALLAAALSPSMATSAVACTAAGDLRQAFFGARPAKVPRGLTVLKVRAPEKAEDSSPIPVKMLEAADGVPAGTTVFVKLESPNESSCDVRDLGVLGQPAYVFGVYERSGDGPAYFRALWLHRNYASLRKQRPWTSYIVDPAVRATAEGMPR